MFEPFVLHVGFRVFFDQGDGGKDDAERRFEFVGGEGDEAGLQFIELFFPP